MWAHGGTITHTPRVRVDSAGLDVGMTRGCTRKTAIVWSQDAAREREAESRLRGIPEISIDGSIRAARTELVRARTPRDAAAP